ncbi:60 kDa SS-A/Ro ribonucleoprotein, partial [Lamellibrachia satsuma]
MAGQQPAGQVLNHLHGYVFKVDDLARFTRFLCLGAEGGTYYVSEQELKRENVQCITRLIAAGRGHEVVQTLIDFSVSGRTAKQNGLMFAMAMCARQSVDPDTKKFCYDNLHLVCRIPTHLFMFVSHCEALSEGTGWGRAHRRAIVHWYKRFGATPADARRLAMLVTKYKNRNGWSHLDILRLAHPKPDDKDNGLAAIFKYIVKGFDEAKEHFQSENLLAYIQAIEDVKAQRDPLTLDTTGLAELIRQHRLVREHVNTQLLNSPHIWEALLEHMPMTAMIRNLGKMSAIGMLRPGSSHEAMIVSKFKDKEVLRRARIHPFNVLVALHTYKNGRGDLGSLTWIPNAAVMEALDAAFYQTFKFVEPTNKRYLLALDVSGSMFWGSVIGSRSIQPGSAAAALSLVTAATETHCEFVGFSDCMEPLAISPDMALPEVEQAMQHVSMGGTDCSLPMVYAREKKKLFDVFVVYTDCETNGRQCPAEALRQYRRQSGISDAKLIVCAMTSNGFSIADPDDPNMMDMAGFDSNGPQVMRDFVGGSITAGRSVHAEVDAGVNVDVAVDPGVGARRLRIEGEMQTNNIAQGRQVDEMEVDDTSRATGEDHGTHDEPDRRGIQVQGEPEGQADDITQVMQKKRTPANTS